MVFEKIEKHGDKQGDRQAIPDSQITPAQELPYHLRKPINAKLPTVLDLTDERRRLLDFRSVPLDQLEPPTGAQLARIGGIGPRFQPPIYHRPPVAHEPVKPVKPTRLLPGQRPAEPDDPLPIPEHRQPFGYFPDPRTPKAEEGGIKGVSGGGMQNGAGRQQGQGGRGQEVIDWMKKLWEKAKDAVGAQGATPPPAQKAAGIGVMGIGATMMVIGADLAIGGGAITAGTLGVGAIVGVPAVVVGAGLAFLGTVAVLAGQAMALGR